MKVSTRCFLFAFLLLMSQQVSLQAREIKEGFDLKWDTGGDLMGFVNNDPDNGQSKVVWQPGGAAGSLGSLKATGQSVSFERFGRFKIKEGDTLSFHYFMHGYTRFDIRLNLARKEQMKKFDRSAMYAEGRCPQDKWVFVQVKLSDIPARNSKKRNLKITPDLIFKSLTFVANYDGNQATHYKKALPGASERYMLIDNLRIGPPISEDEIQVRQRGKATFGNKVHTIIDFETGEDLALLKLSDDVTAKHATKYATSGNGSVELEFKGRKEWATFELSPDLLGDWSGYDFLSFDFTSDDKDVMKIVVEIWDANTNNFGTRCTYDGLNALFPLHKGKTQLLIDLRKARRNKKETKTIAELKKEDLADLSQIKKVKVWLVTTKRSDNYVTYLDNVRLMQEGAIESNMHVKLPEGVYAYDFGENSPLVEGFTEVNLLDVFGDDKSYGFVAPEGLRAEGKSWPDPLTGDYIGGGHDEGGKWRNSSFHFRTRVPDGKYLVWFCAGFFPAANLYIDLNVNGMLLYDGELNKKNIYSKRWFYRFFKTNYSEKPNALWNNYVNKAFPGQVIETEVKNGEFYIKGTNSFISALILVPSDRKAEMTKLTDNIKKERIRYFYKDLWLNRPANEPCSMTDDSFVFYAPANGHSIKPWSGISKTDKKELKLSAARGQILPFQVAIRPFKDLGRVTVSISDLKGPDGSKLPSKDVEIAYKKYMSDGREVRDWGLMPENTVEVEKDLCRAFWFRVPVPQDAKPGTYTATVSAKSKSGTRKIPLTLEVYPFELEDNIPVSYGLYYNAPDHGQHTGYADVNDFQSERDKILREQFAVLSNYGLTSSQAPSPEIKELRGNGALVDLSGLEKVCRVMQDNGMLRNPKQRAMPYLLATGREIAAKMRRKGIRAANEFDMEGFASAYLSAVRKTVQWSQDEEVPLVLWVVDEPREVPNPWNRNLRDTIKYLEIIKNVPGAIRMCTPMGDRSGKVSYLPLLDHLEVVATHPTPHSREIITRTMANPEKELWIYNAGGDRFSNGFYVWRVGATGKFEWHFSMWLYEKKPNGYMGSEIHNPFLNYEYHGFFVAAPLEYKGAVIPRERLITMSMGINDFKYIHTLENRIKIAKDAGTHKKVVAEAEALLKTIREKIPVIPHTRGYESSDDDELAKVGGGIVSDKPVDQWRAKIADLIIKLQ